MLACGFQGVITGACPILPLPDMGQFVADKHGGGQREFFRIFRHIIRQIKRVSNVQTVERDKGGSEGFNSAVAGFWRRPDAFTARHTRPRRTALGQGGEGGKRCYADRFGVKLGAEKRGGKGGFGRGKRTATGGEDEENEKSEAHFREGNPAAGLGQAPAQRAGVPDLMGIFLGFGARSKEVPHQVREGLVVGPWRSKIRMLAPLTVFQAWALQRYLQRPTQ